MFKTQKQTQTYYLHCRHYLLLLALLALPAAARAEGVFIPAPQRVDMVYDAPRDILYISSADAVLRYKLSSNTFLTPFQLGGNLSGIELSPDGHTLAVADRTRSATNNWIHLINLQTGLSSKALFPLASGEGGTFAVAFAGDGSVLVTSKYEGSGWVPLRRYFPATGTHVVLSDWIGQDTMVTSSADSAVIGFAESGTSGGPWGRYRVADNNFWRRQWPDGTGCFNFELGVNKDATEYAVLSQCGAFFYDQNFVQTKVLGSYSSTPLGVAYHPTKSILYLVWLGNLRVYAYDMTAPTWRILANYDFEYSFQSPGPTAFTEGRLKMARDGSLLCATVGGGVRCLQMAYPRAPKRYFYGTEDQMLSFSLTGLSSTGASVPGEVLTNPAHGTLSNEGSNLVYRPEANYNGADTFTYRVREGELYVDGLATIIVSSVNDEPIANGQSVTTAENASQGITLSASDVDGNALTYLFVSMPANGTLSGFAPNLTYTPRANYNGSDSFSFKVNDGVIDSNVATVTINITPVNYAPVAHAQSVATNEDTAKALTLTGADGDGDALTYTIVTPPARGALSGAAPNLVYTPAANYNGADSFTFKVNDGALDSNVATVTLSIAPVNDAPVANAQALAITEDTARSFTLTGADIEGSPLTYAIVAGPTRGTLSGTAPNLTYTPTLNYNGSDSFTFLVSDGSANSSPATVTLSIAPVNDAPTAVADAATTRKNTAVQIAVLANDSDIDGDALTVALRTQGARGTVALVGTTQIRYTPNNGFTGTDTFTYTVRDGKGGTAVGTVTVTVNR